MTTLSKPKTVVENRQARFNFSIEDTLEAGLLLEGWEVKAILAGQATFNGGAAYIKLKDGEAYLESLTITPLKTNNLGLLRSCDSQRPKKLLLKKAELVKLGRKVSEKGFTIVPLALTYDKKLKLQIGVAKGKNKVDKRETIKARDAQRDLARAA